MLELVSNSSPMMMQRVHRTSHSPKVLKLNPRNLVKLCRASEDTSELEEVLEVAH